MNNNCCTKIIYTVNVYTFNFEYFIGSYKLLNINMICKYDKCQSLNKFMCPFQALNKGHTLK